MFCSLRGLAAGRGVLASSPSWITNQPSLCITSLVIPRISPRYKINWQIGPCTTKGSVKRICLLLLLRVSGDIQSHPGPNTPMCSICDNEINLDHTSLRCSECDRCSHTNCEYTGWVKKKTAIIMKGEIRDRHNNWFIPKVICSKGCSNSYNLWKFYMISTCYTEVASTCSTTPSEAFCPRTTIGAKCSKWQLLIKTPYTLTFSRQWFIEIYTLVKNTTLVTYWGRLMEIEHS